MAAEPLVRKPPSGLWADAYPELGSGPISFEDSFCPEFYEKEREHVFRKTWLFMGRVEQLAERGSYFTRELAVAGTSVILVRGADDRIRAFHNMCAHRGNKILWKDSPDREVRGRTREIHCRFHGWRYALDGSLIAPTRPELLRGFDPSKCRLAEIACEVWEGFVFIHLDPDGAREPLRDFLGEFARGLEGFPFHRFSQAYTFRMEVKSNWKIFIDGFAEGYHAPYLHAASLRDTATASDPSERDNPLADALAIRICEPHRMVSWAGERPQKTDNSTPVQCVVEAGAAGLWNSERAPLPPAVNPARSPIWNIDSFQFFPNLLLNIRPDNFSTKVHWPTGPDSHLFEISLHFEPPRSYKERLGQELMVMALHDVVLEDVSPVEGMQAMLKSRAIQQFPLNDEELPIRHLHKVVREYVEGGAAVRETQN